MSNIVKELEKKKLISPPAWLSSNIHYLTVMGSIAYGTNTDTSDFDIYGFAIPKKEDIFPHLRGEIQGFGTQIQRFNQYQEHSILDKEALGGKGREYDLTIFNIVRYFQLAMEGNPNIVDSLFTAADCVLFITAIGSMVRDNRKLFIHKGIIPKLRGYAFSQLHKASSQTRVGKRKEKVDELGWDPKFLSHVVRLTLQAEQVLATGDLDLRLNREKIKAIKRGEVSLTEVRSWFNNMEIRLQNLYDSSKLPERPNEDVIKKLLLDCLEHHYGSLQKVIQPANIKDQALRDIKKILDKIPNL